MMDVTSKKFRYTILLSSCMLTFGSYFAFDLLPAISEALMLHMGIQKDQYQMLFTVYTICNLVSVLFGGLLLDRTGARLGASIFAGLLCVGQILFAIAGSSRSYWLMLVGRCIYGLGGGSIAVCQEAVTTHYFKGKELALAFGATRCAPRLGSVLVFFLAPMINKAVGVPMTLWIGAIMCVISLVFVFVFVALDKINERATQQQMKVTTKKIDLKALLTFRVEYYILTAILALYYGAVFPFIAVATQLFQKIWMMDPFIASVCTGVIYDIALVGFPAGNIVDRIGKRMDILLCATVISIISNGLLLFLKPTLGNSMIFVPWLAMSLLGISYTMVAFTLWSGIPLVVRKNQIGCAMGLTSAIQMGVNTAANFLVGPISYDADIFVFAGMSILTAALVVVVKIVDAKQYNVLNTKDNVGIYKDTTTAQVEHAEPEEVQLLEQDSTYTGNKK